MTQLSTLHAAVLLLCYMLLFMHVKKASGAVIVPTLQCLQFLSALFSHYTDLEATLRM